MSKAGVERKDTQLGHKGAHFPSPTQPSLKLPALRREPPVSGVPRGLHNPSRFLLVVEDDVGDPDHFRRDPEGCDVAEIGRVPAQLVVVPLLCVGRGVRSAALPGEGASGQT